MVKQIRWNVDADEKFESISSYLNDNFSLKAASNFADAVYGKIEMLTLYPEIGRTSPIDPSVFFVRVGKTHLMFYSFDGVELVIIDFFDTRQNPKLRKY